MKRLFFATIVLLLVLSACASQPAVTPTDEATLRVGDGTTEKTYTIEDLQAFPQEESTFNEVTYIGVSLTALLENAGFTPDNLKAVKVIASDGYSVNYDSNQYMGDGIIVAYAQADGTMSAEDGNFRMVLPKEENKLNLRMLVEIMAIP